MNFGVQCDNINTWIHARRHRKTQWGKINIILKEN